MIEVIREKLRMTEEQKEVLLDLASRLEPYLPEIKKRFIATYRKSDPQSGEAVLAELKKMSETYFSSLGCYEGLGSFSDRIGVSAERLYRMKVPFDNLILSLHFIEESCHLYLEKVYPRKEDLVRAILALDHMCHVCFAAVAHPYLRKNHPVRIHDGPPSAQSLTERESEVLRLVADGRRNREIAEILNLSIKTVEHHRSSVMRKLGLRTIAQLVRYVIEHRLIPLR